MARKGTTTIILNVYDLSPANEWLYPLGLGTYHSGVQVSSSDEYSFASGAGIFTNSPRQAAGAIFRESIQLGVFPGDLRQVEAVVSQMKSDFPGDSYNLLRKNCNCFANALAIRLLGYGIPGYVNRLADLGAMVSCLLPPTLTGQSPVGDTSDRQKLLTASTTPFAGSGFKVGGTAAAMGDTAESAGLNDRRERVRAAALNRMQSTS